VNLETNATPTPQNFPRVHPAVEEGQLDDRLLPLGQGVGLLEEDLLLLNHELLGGSSILVDVFHAYVRGCLKQIWFSLVAF